MLSAYSERRDWLIPALSALPGVTCAKPRARSTPSPASKQGTIRIGTEFRASNNSFARRGARGRDARRCLWRPGYLRVSYATSLAKLQEAVAV